ncbi:MAG TPA: hypothetical protein ENK05_09980 [Gammaproteobacteria bacterium]|nr:hypothetical protein [Gammaproteobacteria bacterium]
MIESVLFWLDGRPWITTLFACALVLALADAGILGNADAVIGAIVLVLIRPAWAPWLALVVATIQDAPGLAGIWWYVGVGVLGSYITLAGMAAKLRPRPASWGRVASVVILYAMAVSLIQGSLGGHPQSIHRNPLLVGGLILFMVWSGLYTGQILARNAASVRTTVFVIFLLVFHGMIVALIQAFYSPTFLASAHGAIDIESAVQLVVPTVFGIPRLTGTFLTPNGFALAMLLLLLLVPAVRGETSVRPAYTGVWLVSGGLLSMISFSKALAIFYLISSWLMLFRLFGKNRRAILLFMFASALVTGAVLWWMDLQLLSDAFRLTGELGGTSYRSRAWSLTLSDFRWEDWLFGTGLAYWPVFFQHSMGESLADPHSWVLSVPGTFGLPGLLFYLFVAYGLVSIVRSDRSERGLVASIFLVLFFIKDLFSMPSLLGNTPLTFLVWVGISALRAPRSTIN